MALKVKKIKNVTATCIVQVVQLISLKLLKLATHETLSTDWVPNEQTDCSDNSKASRVREFFKDWWTLSRNRLISMILKKKIDQFVKKKVLGLKRLRSDTSCFKF